MQSDRVEWPTIVVAATIWGGFVLVLLVHDRLPGLVLVGVLGVLAAWYGSLQHEVIHGHPTPWPAANTALVAAPLGLAVAFSAYRDSHRAHHRSPELTDAVLDPESFHVTPTTWARCGPVRRVALRALRTLTGRMVLGPLLAAGRNVTAMVHDARTRRGALRLAGHVAAIAAVLAVVVASGLSPLTYVVGVVWVGGALTLLRSFAEHRWSATGERSAVVRTNRVMALLYLNNNLHLTHHDRPGAPWYELPAVHLALDGDARAAAGGGLYAGYSDVARRYLVRAFDAPVASAVSAPPPTPTDLVGEPRPQPAPAA